MMPVIRAEESLENIQNLSCGTGNLTNEGRNKIINRLEKVVDSREKEEPKNNNAKYAMLASMGMTVVDMRRKK